jgi:hypothetical protein
MVHPSFLFLHVIHTAEKGNGNWELELALGENGGADNDLLQFPARRKQQQ